jgi:hypothetical protein
MTFEEWSEFKSEFKANISETIERSNADKETLEMMLIMLENIKVKSHKRN